MFLKAKEEDLKVLNQLMIASEGYWGFDAKYLENFKKQYAIDGAYIRNHWCYILKEDNVIKGFYGFSFHSNELEYLYVLPDCMGQGIGRRLWQHMLMICHEAHIKEIFFVTSKAATGFYEKLGGQIIGIVESKVKPGRMIPKFKYILE